MKFLQILGLVLLATPALAQTPPDVVSKDGVLTAMTAAEGDTPVFLCWYLDGDDFLDQNMHVDCAAVSGFSEITQITVEPSARTGVPRVYRGVTMDAEFEISDPSPNTDTVPLQDLPGPPILLP